MDTEGPVRRRAIRAAPRRLVDVVLAESAALPGGAFVAGKRTQRDRTVHQRKQPARASPISSHGGSKFATGFLAASSLHLRRVTSIVSDLGNFDY